MSIASNLSVMSNICPAFSCSPFPFVLIVVGERSILWYCNLIISKPTFMCVKLLLVVQIVALFSFAQSNVAEEPFNSNKACLFGLPSHDAVRCSATFSLLVFNRWMIHWGIVFHTCILTSFLCVITLF